jgi:hypothetical protein
MTVTPDAKEPATCRNCAATSAISILLMGAIVEHNERPMEA